MSNLRILAAAYFLGVALLVGGAMQLRADPILEVIDIRPIIARHNIGNAHGLAFNPDANVIYLAHGSDSRGGFIYTLDVQGSLLHEFDFQSAYRPGAYPGSLSYDRSSGHLFVAATVPAGEGFVTHLVEIDPHTANILSDLPLDVDGLVRDDGIWQARFAEDLIRHYTRDGVFIEDVSVAGSFPGFPGPYALTSSFMGGFFIVDHFGRRIVEVDRVGNEVAAVSTAILGDGRGLAIDSDVNTQRIFLQVNNEEIYVLSSEFIGVIKDPLTTVGLYDPAEGRFRLRTEHAGGRADSTFRFGPTDSSRLPLAGDWDGNGQDTIGLYDPDLGQFYLNNRLAWRPADYRFRFGPQQTDWLPLAGDWNGDGITTVGLYDPTHSKFFLKNSHTAGATDRVVRFGPGGFGWLPIAGDWDGDGRTTIGLYDPVTSRFYLRNRLAGGAADLSFRFGMGNQGQVPLTGDWDGDGVTTIGLYDPATSRFYLNNRHAGGAADISFRFGRGGFGWLPVTGQWEAP